MEQNNLYNQINFTASPDGPQNAGPYGTQLKILICPSDTFTVEQLPPGMGGNNYFANYGTNIQFFQNSTVANGAFALRDIGLSLLAITDGTSNTAAFSEMRKGDFNNAVYSKADWINVSALGLPSTADQAYAICQSANPQNLSYQCFSAGGEWLSDDSTGTAYTHVVPPNTTNCCWLANLTFAVTASSAGLPSTADQAYAICQSINPLDLAYQCFSAGGEWLSDDSTGTAYLHVVPPNTTNCCWLANLTLPPRPAVITPTA